MTFLACLPLLEADITAVLELDQRCLGGLWTRSGYQRELESDCSDLRVLVLSNRKRLASMRPGLDVTADTWLLGTGCLWAILDEAHITTLIIDPSAQGKKLGQLLLCELLLLAQQRGLTRATLEVRVSNEPALGLYQKFGFKEAGQRKRYYADGENARILWRSGLQEEPFATQIRELHREAVAQLCDRDAITYISAR